MPAEEWSLIDKPIKVKTRDAYSSYDLLCQTDEKSGIGITSTIAIDDIVKDIDGIVSKALEIFQKQKTDMPNPERFKEPSSSPSPEKNKIKQVGETSNTPPASSL